MKTNNIQQGFTIVELLITIVIIGILTTISIVSYNGIQYRAIADSLRSDLSNAADLLKIDQANNSTSVFPASLAAVNNNKGVPASSGTTYQYTVDNTNTPRVFCLTATRGTQSFSINQEGIPSPNVCPILYYDASITASYPNTGVAVNDLSGNGKGGTLENGASYSSAKGGAFSFDGVDDYLDIGTISPLSAYSAEVWIKANKLTGGNADQNEYGFTIMSASSNYALRVSVGGSTDSTEVKFRAFSSSSTVQATSGANLNTTDWFHITATATKNSVAIIYVNGVEKGSFATGNVACAGIFTIGDLRPNKHIGFDGLITGVKVYDRVLSASEIAEDFNATRARYGV